MKKVFLAVALVTLAATGAWAQPVPAATANGVVSGTATGVGRADNAGNLQNIQIIEGSPNPVQGSLGYNWSGGERIDTLKTAPSVIAPGLTATPATCLGSKSGGVSLIGAGATAASTVEDGKCNRREFFKMYTLAGFPELGFMELCNDPEQAANINAGRLVIMEANMRTAAAPRPFDKDGKPVAPMIRVVPPACPTAESATSTAQPAAVRAGVVGGTSADPYISGSGRQWPSPR